ncbi:MAG: thioredoxin domain-containing protein [Candidatus Omnitrophica bacterium]|nr:thioredoxin domain-containing protein [Candidatus Omnitrophota bacterium]
MAQSSKLKITLLIVVVAVVAVFAAKSFLWKGEIGSSSAFRQKGNAQAPVKIVEYVDLQCPACAYGSLQIENYLQLYPEKIFVEIKFYPLGMHVHSLIATKFALCAGRAGQFWPFFETVMANQKQWISLMDAQPAFLQIVEDIGLNKNDVIACTVQDELRTNILTEKDAGSALGIKSTPTYFINGKMIVGVKEMMEEVDRILGVKTTPITVAQ